jgi:hypothetical protein
MLPEKVKDLKGVTKLEFMDITLYEKKNPIWDSTILDIPVKYIAGVLVACKLLKK